MTRIARSALILLALTLTACGGGGGDSYGGGGDSYGGGGGYGAANAPAIPSQVTLDPTEQTAIIPLADGLSQTYSCSDGFAGTFALQAYGPMNGEQTFFVSTQTIPLTGLFDPNAVVGNDGNGNTSNFGLFDASGNLNTITPATVVPANPIVGATYTNPDSQGGTISATFTGVTTKSIPAGTFSNAYAFVITDTSVPGQTENEWDVRGIGAIENDVIDNSGTTSCTLDSTNYTALQSLLRKTLSAQNAGRHTRRNTRHPRRP